MTVYVESNFVLEMALLQEQHAACEALLELCGTKRIRLAIPVFAMVEPFGTLYRRRAERNLMKQSVDATLRELGRSAPLAQKVDEVKMSLRDLLVANSEEEFRRWKSARSRIAGAAELIPFDEPVFRSALDAEVRFDLKLPDAVIYASVHEHLARGRTNPSCFLTETPRTSRTQAS